MCDLFLLKLKSQSFLEAYRISGIRLISTLSALIVDMHAVHRNKYTIWCVTHKKALYTICGQRRSRSPCAFQLSDLSILRSSTYTRVSVDSASEQSRPWSASADLACIVRKLQKGSFRALRIIENKRLKKHIFNMRVYTVYHSYNSIWM